MIKKKAFAKLNLNLHVFPEKNNKGYHPVHFVNTQLELHDELIFEPIEKGIKVVCVHKEMPKQEDNLVYKAAVLLQKITPKKQGIKITINKNIPIRAGFGGGSSDAAVTVRTLSELWNINITQDQLSSLANILGKDVHYFLSGGLAEIAGDGDKVVSLPFNLSQFWLVILVPNETKPSTEWMYLQIDKTRVGKHLNYAPKLIEAIKSKNGFLNYVFNDFESGVLKYFPITAEMKKDLKDTGAITTLLCGSGLSMIGFFNSQEKAMYTKELLADKYKETIVTHLT